MLIPVAIVFFLQVVKAQIKKDRLVIMKKNRPKKRPI